jgi:hypothetical protein
VAEHPGKLFERDLVEEEFQGQRADRAADQELDGAGYVATS